MKSGNSKIRVDIDYDGGGAGKGANVKLMVNNEQVASGRLEKINKMRFSIDEGADALTSTEETHAIRPIGDQDQSAFLGVISTK